MTERSSVIASYVEEAIAVEEAGLEVPKKSYLIHFSGAKRAETRQRRIEKCRDKVLEGKGFHER